MSQNSLQRHADPLLNAEPRVPPGGGEVVPALQDHEHVVYPDPCKAHHRNQIGRSKKVNESEDGGGDSILSSAPCAAESEK